MRNFAPSSFIFWLLCIICTVGGVALAADNRPIEVSSDRADYSTDGSRAVFSGNVVVSAGGLSVYAAQLSVTRAKAGNVYLADGMPLSLFCSDCADYVIHGKIGNHTEYDTSNNILRLTGGIDLCAGEDCTRGKLSADNITWQRDKDLVLLTGAPIVNLHWQEEDAATPIILHAKKVEYRPTSGEVVLTGKAQIRRDNDNITGRIIRVNVKTGTLAVEGASDERVRATFDNNDE